MQTKFNVFHDQDSADLLGSDERDGEAELYSTLSRFVDLDEGSDEDIVASDERIGEAELYRTLSRFVDLDDVSEEDNVDSDDEDIVDSDERNGEAELYRTLSRFVDLDEDSAEDILASDERNDEEELYCTLSRFVDLDDGSDDDSVASDSIFPADIRDDDSDDDSCNTEDWDELQDEWANLEGNLSTKESEEGVPATRFDQAIPTCGENYTFLPSCSSIKKSCGSCLATSAAIKRQSTADLATKAMKVDISRPSVRYCWYCSYSSYIHVLTVYLCVFLATDHSL